MENGGDPGSRPPADGGAAEVPNRPAKAHPARDSADWPEALLVAGLSRADANGYQITTALGLRFPRVRLLSAL